MNQRRGTNLLSKIISLTLLFAFVVPVSAQAEELYTLQNANGQLTDRATLVCSDDVCGPNGSFSTNPETMAQVSASYNCSPGPCVFVHVDSQTRQPISSGQEAVNAAAAKAAADAATAASAKIAADAAAAAAAAAIAAGASQTEAEAAAAATVAAANSNPVSGIGIIVDSISQTDIQFGICFYSRTQSRISYTNVTYSWALLDGSRTIDSGSGPNPGVTLIESGACNYNNSKILGVRVSNLAPGTTYYIETSGLNAGVRFSNRESFVTSAASAPVITPPSDTSTVQSETVTVRVETSTVITTPSPATVGNETQTVFLAPTTTANESSALSAEPTGATPIESDGEEIDAPPAADISVKKESTGKYLISLDSNIYEDTLFVRAFKKGSKIVIYKVTTNIDGLAAIRTSRNLSGFKLAVYVGNDFLDSIKLA